VEEFFVICWLSRNRLNPHGLVLVSDVLCDIYHIYTAATYVNRVLLKSIRITAGSET